MCDLVLDGGSGLRAQIFELCLENSEHLPQDGELTLLLLIQTAQASMVA